MQQVGLPSNEAERLTVLESCNIMDTGKDERFDRLTRLATRIFGASVSFIGLVDGGFQWMKSNTSPDIAPFIERRLSVCNIIIQTGQPLVSGNLKTDPRFEGHPTVPLLTLHFYAGVPLIMDDVVLGTMCVMDKEPRNADEFPIDILQELAAVVVDEIALWKLTTEMQARSEIDHLTGLPNRRRFDEALDRAVRRGKRTALPLSALLIDLDKFKLLNDMAGHQAGDEALRQVGALLSGSVKRPYDLAARYGGEEFAVLLPDTDMAGAVSVADDIQRTLRGLALPHPATDTVTASIGVATVAGHSAEAMPLVGAADAALYAAKRGGRNRVVTQQGPEATAAE